MIIREATRADLVAFYGRVPRTVRALAAVKAGEVLGIGGYYLDGGVAVVFTDQRGLTKREIVRGARAVLKMVRETGLPIAAIAGDDGAVALQHFGFERVGDYWRLA